MRSSVQTMGMLFLLLLVSHECITVATRIRQGVTVQKQLEMHDTMFSLVKLGEDLGMDDGNFESFMEVEETDGMSMEGAKRATNEIRSIHKSLKEGFKFKNSPILEDLNDLEMIPEDKVLSPMEVKDHREAISSLLEKATSKMDWGFGKASKASSKTSLGKCERTTWGTCGKHSQCRPDKDDPCRGECMCDTKRINECKCVAKGTIDRLSEKKALAKVDTGTILDNEKSIEKALDWKGILFSVGFGFVDGFLGGMATGIKKGWKDGKCQDPSAINAKFKEVLRSAKRFWHSIKKVHRKVWTRTGRKDLFSVLKRLLKSLVEALKEVWKFTMRCPATKMIARVLGMIVGLVVLNMAFVATGLVVIPILVKLVGGLMGLLFAFKYMKATVIEIYKEIKKVKSGSCNVACKKKLIEKSSAMLGAIAEVVLLGGLGDFAKVSKNPAAKLFFKKYKIEMSPSFIGDMQVLKDAAKNARKGVRTPLKEIANGVGLKRRNTNKRYPAKMRPLKTTSRTRTRPLKTTSRTRTRPRYRNRYTKKHYTAQGRPLKTTSRIRAKRNRYNGYPRFSPAVRRRLVKNRKRFAYNYRYGPAYKEYVARNTGSAMPSRNTDSVILDGAADGSGADGKNFIKKFDWKSIKKFFDWKRIKKFFDWKRIGRNAKRILAGILPGTRYVNKIKENFIKPENDTESKRLFDAMQVIVDSKSKDEDDNRRRRLLGKAGEGYDYSALWGDFVDYVEVDEKQADVCSSGYDMLSQVDVYSDGYFEFRCDRSPRLCKCISAIGSGKVGDQVFFADDLELTVFRADDGFAAYEIAERGEYIGYGDVNDGRVDRRRRLLQGGHHGAS